jgi:indole-3-glycerol phosphate synthase
MAARLSDGLMTAKLTTSFAEAIASENALGRIAVIPDIKCLSPKVGDLLVGRDPVQVARQLVDCGAPLLSVVTEAEHFGGSLELLAAVAEVVTVPVLRKDFITRPSQLEETVAMGASAVLLIAATVDEDLLVMLYEAAIDIGLEPLIEVHNQQEMILASRLETRLVGINNRDILSFELDDGGPNRTASLADCVPTGSLLISESGILTATDAAAAVASGAHAVLVGTALWQAQDIEVAYRELQVAYRERQVAARL